jgi:BCD family chlorophyll transporter-like MFS transporter
MSAVAAVRGIEPASPAGRLHEPQARPAFRQAFGEAWRERQTRRFTIFVFVSMLAYSAQDLILEPFGGVVIGMVLVALAGALLSRRFPGLLRGFCVLGCVGSAASLAMLATGSGAPDGFPLHETVFALGVSNGVFAVAAIGSMMALAGHGKKAREGVRMGIWGAAQAIAFGAGGFAGTVLVDAATAIVGRSDAAYGIVFGLEAILFLISAALALGAISVAGSHRVSKAASAGNDRAVAA